MSNCDAISWWEGSVARMLYPNANLDSQRISDFLKSIGKVMLRKRKLIEGHLSHIFIAKDIV